MEPEYLRQPKKIGFLRALYILMGLSVVARIADIIGRSYTGALESVSAAPDFPLVVLVEAIMLISKIIAIRNRFKSTNYIFLIASFAIEYIWWFVWPITYGAAMEYKHGAIAATIAVAYALTTPWLICAIRMKRYIVCCVSPWSEVKYKGFGRDDYVCEICDKNTRRLELVEFNAENDTKRLMICPKCMWRRDLSAWRVYKLKDEDETIDLTEELTPTNTLEGESEKVMETKPEKNILTMQDIDRVLRKKQISKQERPTEESYGFEINNPICTGSENDTMRYLTALRTEDGGSVEFEQTNTIRLDKFNGLENIVIECYAVKTSSGEKTLYLCPDGFCKYIAPKGFVLSEIDYDKVYVKDTVDEVKTEAVIEPTVAEKPNNDDNRFVEIKPATAVTSVNKPSAKTSKAKIFLIVALLFFLLSALTLCVYLFNERNELQKALEKANGQSDDMSVEYSLLLYNNAKLEEEKEALNADKTKLQSEKSALEKQKKSLESDKRDLEWQLSIMKNEQPGDSKIVQQMRDFSYGTHYSNYYSCAEVVLVKVGETKSFLIYCSDLSAGNLHLQGEDGKAVAKWGKSPSYNYYQVDVTGQQEGTTLLTFLTDNNDEKFNVLVVVLAK